MKSVKHIVLLLFFMILLVCCKTRKPVVIEHTTQTQITKTVHDTVFTIKKDSSSYLALLECQNGKVAIKQVVQAESGRTLKSPRVWLDNNQLKVDCHAQEQKLKCFYINTHKTSASTITKPIEVNKLSWWQNTQIILFKIYAIGTLVVALWFFVKHKIIS